MNIKVNMLVAVKLPARTIKSKQGKITGFIGRVQELKQKTSDGKTVTLAVIDFEYGVDTYPVEDLLIVDKDSIRKFNSYTELEKAHQEDVNEFPITYMFGIKSDEEIKNDIALIGARYFAECTSMFGCGDVIKKSDVKSYLELCEKHRKERKLFYDNCNERELYNAIVKEMNNYEYVYSRDKENVLSALGKKLKDLEEDEVFRKAWNMAEKHCMQVAF